ncbi:MAG: hypothetical protein SRB2_00562 [Desulfobacteraceae bacterium Eth-SRB2]|nr:MAG: hypothetical protein SRB2_00562 [Desulfobacteraceae bacterium Eth-SRB2]
MGLPFYFPFIICPSTCRKHLKRVITLLGANIIASPVADFAFTFLLFSLHRIYQIRNQHILTDSSSLFMISKQVSTISEDLFWLDRSIVNGFYDLSFVRS